MSQKMKKKTRMKKKRMTMTKMKPQMRMMMMKTLIQTPIAIYLSTYLTTSQRKKFKT